MRPPWKQHPVVIPSISFSDYLQLAIAEKCGICMGLEFLTPSHFVSRVMERAKESSPWSAKRLTWKIFPMAHRYVENLGLNPRGAFTRDLFAISQLLADRLDQYGHFRPEMIRAWSKGERFFEKVNTDESWQKSLWSELRDAMGKENPHPATVMEGLGSDPDFLQRVQKDFPKVTLIGTGAIDPLLVEALKLLSGAGAEISIHVLLPTLRYLGDLKGRTETPSEFEEDSPHPLLASMGRHAIGSFRLLQELDENMSGWPELPQETPFSQDMSLLERLQQDIRSLSAPHGAKSPADDDRSISIHACFGARREMEVLRDEILRAFRDIPDLRPNDIHIVTPSLETYAPLVAAVLEQAAGAGNTAEATLQVRVTELPRSGQNPLLAAMFAMLDMAIQGRHEISELLNFPYLEPVQRALGIVGEEQKIECLRGEIKRSGITRGTGGNDIPPAPGTWQFAAERLIAGLWMNGECEARYPEGDFILPTGDELGGNAELVRSFVEWLENLKHAMQEWQNPATAAAWASRFRKTLTTLLGCEDGEDAPMRPHLHFLESLDCREPVDAGTIRDWLLSATADARRRSPNSGKIIFGEFRHLQNIPCRVLAMVGMQDAAFPRSARFPAWDLLQIKPKIWDRNPRIEDRQFFLDALLAPKSRLIITGSTRNIRTNKEEPFSACVDELLRVLATMGVPKDRTLVRHPLQPFSAEYFKARTDSIQGRSFSKTNVEVAKEIAKTEGRPHGNPFWTEQEKSNVPDVLEIRLDDLVSFWKNPAGAYIRAQGIGSLRNEESDKRLDRPPLELDNLERWKVKNAMVEELAFKSGNTELLKARLIADRLLPGGKLCELIWSENLNAAKPLAAKIQEIFGESLPINCVTDVSGFFSQTPIAMVRIVGRIRLTKDKRLLAYHVGAANKARHFLGPWIESVCASHAGHHLSTLLLTTENLSENNTRPPINPEENNREKSANLLRELATGYLIGQQKPLCYAPETSRETVRKLNNKRPLPPVDALTEAARSKWFSSDFGGAMQEGESKEALLAWRDLDPFEDSEQWCYWAENIAKPLLQWEESREGV